MLQDLTYTIGQDVYYWSDKPGLKSYFDEREKCYVTDYRFTSHTGTHIDAPYHHFAGGRGLNDIPLEDMIGKAYVFDAVQTEGGVRIPDDFQVPEEAKMLLIKTLGYRHWKNLTDFRKGPYLTSEAAEMIAKMDIKGILIDCPVDKYAEDFLYPNHKTILGSDKFMIEYVTNIDDLTGLVDIIALPVKTTGKDGALIRVLAKR